MTQSCMVYWNIGDWTVGLLMQQEKKDETKWAMELEDRSLADHEQCSAYLAGSTRIPKDVCSVATIPGFFGFNNIIDIKNGHNQKVNITQYTGVTGI